MYTWIVDCCCLSSFHQVLCPDLARRAVCTTNQGVVSVSGFRALRPTYPYIPSSFKRNIFIRRVRHKSRRQRAMQQHLASLRLRMLPAEIVHDIVREAWLTIVDGDWALRWDFYHAVSEVSHSFNAAMQNAALRAVAIRTPEDFTKYKCLVRRRFGLNPDSKDGDERARTAAVGFFAHSELHIVLADWTCPGSGFQYRTDYAQIPQYIPACKYLQVLVKELPSNDQYTLPYRPLFQLLSQYPGTRHMSLRWTYTHSSRYILPRDPVRGVTYLRVREYPRCVCHNLNLNLNLALNLALAQPPILHAVPAGDGDARTAHSAECFSFHLPALFPQLRHLHFDTPFFLKNVATPPGLVRLTIEAPPAHFTPALGRFSSLVPWNIVSALSYGFFRNAPKASDEVRPDADANANADGGAPPPPRKKIVVNTGPDEPSGWPTVQAAAKAHGVDVELRHVYPNPPPPPPAAEKAARSEKPSAAAAKKAPSKKASASQ